MKASRLTSLDPALFGALDVTYFHVELPPGAGNPIGSPTVDTSTDGFSFEVWSAAGVTGRRLTRVLRGLWGRCSVRLNLWYSANVGSTSAFTITATVRQVDAGSLGSAFVTSCSLASFACPGPAVADTLLFTSTLLTGIIVPTSRLVQFSLARLGPDANANAFRLFGAEFVVVETA